MDGEVLPRWPTNTAESEAAQADTPPSAEAANGTAGLKRASKMNPPAAVGCRAGRGAAAAGERRATRAENDVAQANILRACQLHHELHWHSDLGCEVYRTKTLQNPPFRTRERSFIWRDRAHPKGPQQAALATTSASPISSSGAPAAEASERRPRQRLR
eukprot:SAG22_NODE_1334_length_4700_cov_27.727885_7_plen_159_part_00